MALYVRGTIKGDKLKLDPNPPERRVKETIDGKNIGEGYAGYTGLQYVPANDINEVKDGGRYQALIVSPQWYITIEDGEKKGQEDKYSLEDGGGGYPSTRKTIQAKVNAYYKTGKYTEKKTETEEKIIGESSPSPEDSEKIEIPESTHNGGEIHKKTTRIKYTNENSYEEPTGDDKDDAWWDSSSGKWVVTVINKQYIDKDKIEDYENVYQDENGYYIEEEGIRDAETETKYDYTKTTTIITIEFSVIDEKIEDKYESELPDGGKLMFFPAPQFLYPEFVYHEVEDGKKEIRLYVDVGLSSAISNWGSILDYGRQWRAWQEQESWLMPEKWQTCKKPQGDCISASGLNEIYGIFEQDPGYESEQPITLDMFTNLFDNINS